MSLAEIAAGLNDASRLAIINCRESDSGAYWLIGVHATILRVLWKKGLATYRARPSRLTADGLALRNYLKDQSSDR